MNENIIILMGVSGCGKTAVGQTLAQRLGIPFLEGDDFHPSQNIAKMSSGVPLDDDDRVDWMTTIRKAMIQQTGSAIVSCSALKRKHRAFLADLPKPVRFIYLRGDRELLEGRIESRIGHFFDPKLLGSQLASLEEPFPDEDALVVDVDPPVEKIVATIHARLEALDKSQNKSS